MPYLALGRGLRAAGHGVRVATYETFAPLVAQAGLDYHPIHGDVQAIIGGLAGERLLTAGQNVLVQIRMIERTFGRLADSVGRDMAMSSLRDTEAMLAQTPGALYAYDLAECLSIPLIALAVMPLAPTRRFPMVGFPAWTGRLPGFSRLSYTLAEQLVWQVFRAAINRYRRALGLRPQRWRGYFRAMEARPVPVINGISSSVLPRPNDWPAHVHLAGYWFPRDDPWCPPEALCRFLEAGPPPVFLGFGSMPLRDRAQATNRLLEALRLTGQRGVLLAGWGGLGQTELPEDVFRLDYAPFDWLFPRMRAVVHHGGSGTTAMGLRAGVPSILAPFAFDQFFWGARVAELGVGPRPVPYARLTARALAAGITAAVHDAGLRQRAARLGEQIVAEDGVARAVDLIEAYARR